MNAQPATAVGCPSRTLRDRSSVVVAGVLCAVSGLVGMALIVFCRRLAGAFERPAPGELLLATATLIGACCWFTRRLWQVADDSSGARSGARPATAIVAWAPSVAVLLLAVGLSWPLVRAVDWLVWGSLLAADTLWRRRYVTRTTTGNAAATRRSREDAPEVDPSSTTALPDYSDEDTERVVLQQLTRFRSRDGEQTILGSLRAEFLPGQRTSELYIGFCPPFDGTPAIELEQTDGPPSRVSLGQVLPHGARIDVRLMDGSAASPESIRVELFATCPDSRCATSPPAL